MKSLLYKSAVALFAAILLQLSATVCTAADASPFGTDIFKMPKTEIKNIKADHWSISGNNILIRGNVHIPMGELDVYADRAIVNTQSKDIEAFGNIRLFRNVTQTVDLTPSELAKMQQLSGISVTVVGVKTNIFGDQKISAEIKRIDGTIAARSFSANMQTGFSSFTDISATFGNFVVLAKSGERKTNGIIAVKDAEISACNYLASLNSHYSISCASMELTPYDTGKFGVDDISNNKSDYSIYASNCTAKVYGVPFLWLPVLYKPKDENLGLFQIQAGKSSDWGMYVLTSKKFTPLDYPATSVRVMADYYEKRGFGYGAAVYADTENSRTTIFAYSIYDDDPYKSSDADEYNIKLPHQRYDFRINNLTHITPTLDFRGNFEVMSDEFFNQDFFGGYYSANPRPVTFAALEKQFDLFSASIYVRPQVNSFFNVVEQLPTARIDVQRQEIFDTNIYYQGSTSLGYFKRRWAEYDYLDKELYKQKAQLKDYDAGRFDTLHFFYYPLKLDFLNIIPRAGFRFTAYSNTSKTKISEDDLELMLSVDDPDSNYSGPLKNYDSKGGSKSRFVGEIGLEMNTKIYRSWQDIRSGFFQLDGLRHMIVPYLNYTYIPEPTLDREHIYYFDDIDRIDKQNFVRLGLVNRLQTRKDNRIVDYMTMENYWDYHFEPQKGFDSIGDFCTKLTWNPIKNMSIETFISLDASGKDSKNLDRKIYRNGRDAGNPGLNWDALNRLSFSLKYEPVKDFLFNLTYQYQNRYRTQSAYSMGSTLTDIESGSAFNRYFDNQTQEITFGTSFPITPDRRTMGRYTVTYDFFNGYISSQVLSVVRRFHCIEVSAEVMLETDTDNGKKEKDISFNVSARLLGLLGPVQDTHDAFLNTARNSLRSDDKGGMF